jgi:carbon starvation protein
MLGSGCDSLLKYYELSLSTDRRRIYALAYRYYSAFLAARVLVLIDARNTPAHTCKDGQNYLPTPKWVLFGHHFAAIAGAGPLVGPTVAAQFGFAPG